MVVYDETQHYVATVSTTVSNGKTIALETDEASMQADVSSVHCLLLAYDMLTWLGISASKDACNILSADAVEDKIKATMPSGTDLAESSRLALLEYAAEALNIQISVVLSNGELMEYGSNPWHALFGQTKDGDVLPAVSCCRMLDLKLSAQQEVPISPVGLVNPANTCYANASLQMYRYIPLLMDRLSKSPEETCSGRLNQALSQLQHFRASARSRAFDPEDFLTPLYPDFFETVVVEGRTVPPWKVRQDFFEFTDKLIAKIESEVRQSARSIDAPPADLRQITQFRQQSEFHACLGFGIETTYHHLTCECAISHIDTCLSLPAYLPTEGEVATSASVSLQSLINGAFEDTFMVKRCSNCEPDDPSNEGQQVRESRRLVSVNTSLVIRVPYHENTYIEAPQVFVNTPTYT